MNPFRDVVEEYTKRIDLKVTFCWEQFWALEHYRSPEDPIKLLKEGNASQGGLGPFPSALDAKNTNIAIGTYSGLKTVVR